MVMVVAHRIGAGRTGGEQGDRDDGGEDTGHR